MGLVNMTVFFIKFYYFIFNIYIYFVFFLYHLLGMSFGIVMLLFRQKRLVTKSTPLWVHSLFLLGGLRLDVKGLDNFSKKAKYLIVMNHASFFDIHAVMAVKPDITWLSKKELMSIPLIGAGVKASGGIPIDRKNFKKSMENIYKIAMVAAPGFALGVFPEGTRTKNGLIQTFKRGFVRILRNSNLSLLPLTLNGFYNFKPKNRVSFHPGGRLEVIIHHPIPHDEIMKLSDQSLIDKTFEIINKDYNL